MEALASRVDIREYRETGGTLILSVSGALDLRTAPEFAERMADSASPRWALVLDLDGLDFMDSAGLGVLLAATDRARQSGCSVSLAPPHGALLRLFRASGLENVLPLRSESLGETAPRVRSRFARIAGRG
jgi:anti-sigma B factor antagonist